MGIEASSSVVTSSTQVVNNTSSSSKSNSSDTSFKDEMSKVSESETKKDTKTSEKDSEKINKQDKTEKKADGKDLSASKDKKSQNLTSKTNDKDNSSVLPAVNGRYSMNDANMMLSNDIAQMIENTVSVNEENIKSWSFGFADGSFKTSLKMNESDANFFINLTQTENVNVQSLHAQAQGMLNNGAETAEVRQNVQVSQALLDALSQARENNQPIRIDFDQNVSVILRVGRDGALSAQFIPGDKAVEQYLRNNIDSLRNSFDEQDLPYQELSYSHSSKEQNQKRRQQNQQGE